MHRNTESGNEKARHDEAAGDISPASYTSLNPPSQSGHYFYYTRLGACESLESPGRPSVCFYNADNGLMSIIGYDLPIEYNQERYLIVGLINDPD